jgi:peptidoglycan-associated lipoprotein
LNAKRAIHTLLLVLIALAVACAKRPAMTEVSAPAPTAAVAAPTPAPQAAAPMAPTPTPMVAAPAEVQRPGAPTEFVENPSLAEIHFDFDRSVIRPGDARILDASAGWLRENPKALVLIEGHCDERGTNEYNLALGERRAQAARSYLVSRGVEAARMSIISYGEERPLCTQHSEGCWAKNRRAHFLTKAQ